jgi:Domain of unknown function (DUF4412)
VNRRFVIRCSVLLFALFATIPLLAQKPQSFSADINFNSPQGMSGTGKLFFSGDKVRMEMSAMGHQSIMISDTVAQTGYVLMPQQKMYMDMSSGMKGAHKGPDWRAYDASNPCANMTDTTCQKVGTEVVNGRTCAKWQFSGKNAESKRTVWIDQATGIPIKTVTNDGATVELTNIKQGVQSPSLFEVPAGYQKFDMGGMMKGMGGMNKQ